MIKFMARKSFDRIEVLGFALFGAALSADNILLGFAVVVIAEAISITAEVYLDD